MGTQDNTKARNKRSIRTAMIAGALIVAGCFTAAFTFTNDTATAAEEPVR
ncbi:hypothetical protein P8Q88_00640 [Qipengyuania sp. XHP0207]|nr:hypothetical protein [Qipengyuania sp. XHP0207]MDG5746677.1 hypothetical protein [Qipengyuania sp. XHP0207]